MQPNDVGIQRILKHIIKCEAATYLMEQTRNQLKANPKGIVVLPTELGPLHNASVSWVKKAYNYFTAHPEIVKQVCTKISF